MMQQHTIGGLGKFWVDGKWTKTLAEALAYAKRTGAKTIKATDGWTPTVVVAWV